MIVNTVYSSRNERALGTHYWMRCGHCGTTVAEIYSDVERALGKPVPRIRCPCRDREEAHRALAERKRCALGAQVQRRRDGANLRLQRSLAKLRLTIANR